MNRRMSLTLGLLLAGCAQEVPPETVPSPPEVTAPSLGAPCSLSTGPQESAARIFLEVATLQGDLTSILRPNSHAAGHAAGSLTFPESLANQQWQAVTVRNAIINDGERKTYPWDFGSPPLSTQCPAGGTWELSVTPHVTEQDPATVRIEVQILPTHRPGATPEAEQIPEGCGVQTTLVLDDQQLGVLMDLSRPEPDGVLTTVTPYVVWEEKDLMRLAECKRTHSQSKVDPEASVPPQHN